MTAFKAGDRVYLCGSPEYPIAKLSVRTCPDESAPKEWVPLMAQGVVLGEDREIHTGELLFVVDFPGYGKALAIPQWLKAAFKAGDRVKLTMSCDVKARIEGGRIVWDAPLPPGTDGVVDGVEIRDVRGQPLQWVWFRTGEHRLRVLAEMMEAAP